MTQLPFALASIFVGLRVVVSYSGMRQDDVDLFDTVLIEYPSDSDAVA